MLHRDDVGGSIGRERCALTWCERAVLIEVKNWELVYPLSVSIWDSRSLQTKLCLV